MAQRPTVLTIAGSDSGGGAGIQGDLKTLEAFQVYGLTVLTSITAQNTKGVVQVFDLPAELVASQIRVVAEDISIDAAKTGMLSSEHLIETVAAKIMEYEIRNLVVDPVMRAKSGDPLIALQAQKALMRLIVPLARIVTPNLPEAEQLSGIRLQSYLAMKEAARIIVENGAQSVLIKGGHMEDTSCALDIFFDGRYFHEFSAERVGVQGGVHGTGCAYSSAIAAGLAKGMDILQSISRAKAYITEAIKRHLRVGQGHPVLDHSWNSFNPTS